jgi:hypothetical protein
MYKVSYQPHSQLHKPASCFTRLKVEAPTILKTGLNSNLNAEAARSTEAFLTTYNTETTADTISISDVQKQCN